MTIIYFLGQLIETKNEGEKRFDEELMAQGLNWTPAAPIWRAAEKNSIRKVILRKF